LPILLTSACSAEVQRNIPDQHPFVGCWESADGLAVESWTQDPSGWLFGYAVNRDETGKVTFFEQMRMDGEALYVTGPNDDTIAFKLADMVPDIVFENPDHDFPQRIVYSPSGNKLHAYIELIDGSNRVNFNKQVCD